MKEKQITSSENKKLTIVVSFFLSLTIIVLSLIVVVSVTLFNDREINTKVSQITYTSQLNNDITLASKSIAAKYGMEHSAVADVITPSKISTDMTIYFNAVSSKDPHAAENTISVNELKNQLYNSFLNENKKTTDVEKAKADKASSLIAEEYKKAIILENLEDFYSFADKSKNVFSYIFIAFALVFLVLTYIIIAKNSRRKKHRLLRKFAVVYTSSGFAIIALTVMVKIWGVLERITFYSSQREYNVFMKIFGDFMNSLILVGGMLSLAGIIMMTLWYFTVAAGKRDSLFK